MKHDPILTSRSFTNGNVPMVMFVHGGLHNIKGNNAPYFTLTYDEHRKGFPNQCESGGAGHEYILEHFPQFADLAALHLSDIDGVPMHTEANGWYQLAGALGGAGERFHAGNSKRNFPLPPERVDPAKPWQTTEYRYPTESECLDSFSRHCRISRAEAEAIAKEIKAAFGPEAEDGPAYKPSDYKRGRAVWASIMETMRPRWKAEAEACIKSHSLKVFGDPYQKSA